MNGKKIDPKDWRLGQHWLKNGTKNLSMSNGVSKKSHRVRTFGTELACSRSVAIDGYKDVAINGSGVEQVVVLVVAVLVVVASVVERIANCSRR